MKIYQVDDKSKEFIFQKDNLFLNKKRNIDNKNDNIEILGFFNSKNIIGDNLEKEFPNNILINDTCFNNKKLKIDEELSIISDNKKVKKEITNEITCFSSIKNDTIEIRKISENHINISNIDNENLLNVIKKEKKEGNDFNKNSGNKGKDKVCCFALDLLNENGAFQIKFGKENAVIFIKNKRS